MAIKKATNKQGDEQQDLQIYQAQLTTALVQARAVAREVFGSDAELADHKLALRVLDYLDFEDNGDPTETQDGVVKALLESKRIAREIFPESGMDPQAVLDVHEVVHEDFFADED